MRSHRRLALVDGTGVYYGTSSMFCLSDGNATSWNLYSNGNQTFKERNVESVVQTSSQVDAEGSKCNTPQPLCFKFKQQKE